MGAWNGVAGNVVFEPNAATLWSRVLDLRCGAEVFSKTGRSNPNGEPEPGKIPNGIPARSQINGL